MKKRRLAAVSLVVALGLLTMLSGIATASRPHHKPAPNAAFRTMDGPIKYATIQGKEYAEWQCTLGGTVVAAGITFVGLSPVSAIAGILGGGSFTAGCEMGYSKSHPRYMSGVPRSDSCWEVYPHGKLKRKVTECLA
jgi:hypothetical protein